MSWETKTKKIHTHRTGLMSCLPLKRRATSPSARVSPKLKTLTELNRKRPKTIGSTCLKHGAACSPRQRFIRIIRATRMKATLPSHSATCTLRLTCSWRGRWKNRLTMKRSLRKSRLSSLLLWTKVSAIRMRDFSSTVNFKAHKNGQKLKFWARWQKFWSDP